MQRMENEKVARAILVVPFDQKITGLGKKAIAMARPKFMFEYFNEEELIVDITEHELVSSFFFPPPPHRGA